MDNVNFYRVVSIYLLCLLGLAHLDAGAGEYSAQQLIDEFGLRESKIPSREMPGWRKPENVVLWGDGKVLKSLRSSFPDLSFTATRDIDKLRSALRTADVYMGYCIPSAIPDRLHVSFIQSLAVGVEGCIQSPVIQQSDLTLSNSQRLSGPGIADHAIAMMLSLVRRLDEFGLNQSARNWDRTVYSRNNGTWEIAGRTMLVVGLGGIGSATAKRAHGLGMKVVAIRNSRREGPDYVDYVGLPEEILDLTAKADVVVNTVPLTDKTTGMYNRAFFKTMPEHAYFITVGRGKSTVTEDLVAALKAGELAGAGLEVTDPEPLPEDHELWHMPRVIITPHVGNGTKDMRQRVMTLAKENLRRYIAGEKILSRVDLKRGY